MKLLINYTCGFIAMIKILWNFAKESWYLQRDFEKVRIEKSKQFSKIREFQNSHCGHVMSKDEEGIYHCPEFGCAQWGIEYQEEK